MKTPAIILVLAIALLSFAGCEKTETLEPDSIYKEKTVVFSSLKSDSLFQGVTFTRTLPLNTEFDIKKAELKDVTAYLKINGVSIIPIIYTADGIYKPRDLMMIHSGDVYELFAKYGEKSIYARTRIPVKPSVFSATLVNSKYIEARIAPRENEAYAAAWFITGANQYSYSGLATDFFEVYKTPENPPASVSIRTMDIPEDYRTDNLAGKTYLKVISFDNGFYDYFRTRGNNQQVHNSFTQGGSQVIWNVYGTDVIGMFIGSASGELVKPK
ncbi:MAG: hypothetical protein ACM3UR_15955 [Bacteroidota bacterium]